MNLDTRFILRFLVILLVGVTGCKGKDVDAATAMELRVGYMPIAECLPLYVAASNGYFEAEGLTVQLQPLAGGAVILSGLVAGSLDVGFSNVVSLVLHRAQGRDFFAAYGGTYESEGYENHALIAKKSGSTVNPAPRAGWRIGVNTRANIEELMVVRYLNQLGISSADVTFQPIGFPQMLPALESGAIDAASIVEPFISLSGVRDGDTSGYVLLGNHYLAVAPRTLVATYVSSREILQSKPEALAAFIRAMRRATAFIAENESQSREMLREYTRIPLELLPSIGLSDFRDELDIPALEEVITTMRAAGMLEGLTVPAASSMVETIVQ